MPDITPQMVKDLRETTGAGMMDCKKALTETGGSMQDAQDWLRKKGLSAAAKKSGRVAAEGLVAVATEGTKGAIIELNAETDFVARNDQFQQAAKAIAGLALTAGAGSDVEKLKNHTCPKMGKTIQETIAALIGTIGENMNLRRCATLSVGKGSVVSYVHSAAAPGIGKIGVLVALESEGDKTKLDAFGRQIAMHIAAARPEALTTKDVDPAKLERERTVLKEQSMASGKPADIAEKMVEGRIRKYYEEVVLLEQIYVLDNKTKISQVMKDAEKEIGKPVAITGFVRFALGEGVEKQQDNFAEEVKKAAGAGA